MIWQLTIISTIWRKNVSERWLLSTNGREHFKICLNRRQRNETHPNSTHAFFYEDVKSSIAISSQTMRKNTSFFVAHQEFQCLYWKYSSKWIHGSSALDAHSKFKSIAMKIGFNWKILPSGYLPTNIWILNDKSSILNISEFI